ncbi:MAG TPA: metalloregulator ArsR/SmtB family transcription factor [Polyangiaceae bacterium]|jgi:DNA-binding transcriptional ArsR family regulator|nr:metalloregulator ArsR/SmtB family transcription factor [Polyangiaceae bacterium]
MDVAIDRILVALAEPTRRAILEAVRERPRSVTDIATDFDVSRPAVSQHLRVLSDAGLLRSQRSGRHNFYALDLRGLATLRAYIEGFWDHVLNDFRTAAVAEAKKKRTRS